MVNYPKIQSTAKALIDSFGGDVTLIKSSKMVDASDEPWRGSSIPNVLPESAGVTVKGVFDLIDERDDVGTLVRRGVQVVYVQGNITDGSEVQKIEEYDYLIRGEEIWKIVAVKSINPAGTNLLYEIEVRQ